MGLNLESPSSMYFNNTITKNKKIKQNFGNFRIVYSNFTYIFFNTTTNILHCNVTKINKYNQSHSSKKILTSIFPRFNILSTKVDNICGTKYIGGNICLDNLFERLVKYSSTQFKVNYNSQKFPGLFIKFNGNTLSGTSLIFKSGKIYSIGIKRLKHFLEL